MLQFSHRSGIHRRICWWTSISRLDNLLHGFSATSKQHLHGSTSLNRQPMSAPVTNSNASARPMLFLPFKIRGLTLKNRLVVPPMVHYRAATWQRLRPLSQRSSRPLRAGGLWADLCRGDRGRRGWPDQRIRPWHLERNAGGKLQAADRFHERRGRGDRNPARTWRAQGLLAAGDGRHGPADAGSAGAKDVLRSVLPASPLRRDGLHRASSPPRNAGRWCVPGRSRRECGLCGFRYDRDPHRAWLSAGLVPSPFPTRAMTNMAATATGACACRSRSLKRCGRDAGNDAAVCACLRCRRRPGRLESG